LKIHELERGEFLSTPVKGKEDVLERGRRFFGRLKGTRKGREGGGVGGGVVMSEKRRKKRTPWKTRTHSKRKKFFMSEGEGKTEAG